MKKFWEKLTVYVAEHQRHISSGALIFGFIVDNLTLSRVDQTYDNAVLIFYILLAGATILIFNFFEVRNLTTNIAIRVRVFAPVIIQYAFGGLFSAFFVFYSRSGSIYSSWPFILLIIILLILNEFLKEKYSRLIYQVAIYFFAIFSYMIFLVPVILKEMGQLIFVYSGIISLNAIYLFTVLIHFATKQKYFNFNKKLWAAITSIFLIVNIFYFTNILPPLPLSMKDSGVYNLIEKSNNDYIVSGKEKTWLGRFFKRTIEVKQNEPIYFFSSVFAPTRLNTKIVHHWDYYDEANKKWIQTTRIDFPISGGRDEGYRGYSMKQNLREGKWRVVTKTANGQTIGLHKFNVVFTKEDIELQKTIK